MIRSSVFLGLLGLVATSAAKPWKGAEVISKQTFKYGAFEGRIRAAKGSGVITPFFLWKDGSEVAGAQWQEQDFEIFGRDGSFQTQVMTPGAPRIEHVAMHYPSTPAYDRYNTYRMEWTPDSICFYFNGVLIRKETNKVEFAKLLDPARAEPAQLRVSIWAGDYAWSGAFDTTAIPADVYVNWIQAYAYTPGAGPGGSNFSLLWRDDFDGWNYDRWWTANWTFAEAVNDYTSDNAKVRDGALNLALTHWTKQGTFRPVPSDDGLTPPLPTDPVDPVDPEEPVGDSVPMPVPGRLGAKDYARAFDVNKGFFGDAPCLSRNPDVDLELSFDTIGGACNISSTQPGDWLEYDLQVDSARRLEIGLNLASELLAQKIKVLLDGEVLSDSVPVPALGWQTFRTVTLPPVAVTAGRHVLRVVFTTGAANLHFLDILPVSSGRAQDLVFPQPEAATYGTVFVKLGAAASSGLPVRYTASRPGVVRLSNDTAFLLAADTVAITAHQDGDTAFRAAAPVSRVLSVTPKPITVVAQAQTKVYGSADPSLTYTATGLVGSDTLTGRLARAAGDTVGAYAIGRGSLASSANYALTFTGDTLRITAKPISVAAQAKTKVYGSTDPSLTYTVTGLVGTDTLTGRLARTAGDTVGAYAIGRGTLASSANYALAFTGDTLRITAKPIAVAAQAKTKVYGSTDPDLTYAVTGLVGSDTLTGRLARASGDTVGAYAIGRGTLASSANYALTFTGDTLRITAKPITAVAQAQTKVYGSTDPVLTFTATGLVGSDTLTGRLARASGDTVGAYAIGRGTLASSANYALTFTGDSLRVTAKPISVVAQAKTKVYGSTDPSLTYTVTGLVGTDTLTGRLARAAGDTVGVYAIGRGTLASSANYALTFTGDTLRITAKPISVAAQAKTKVYGSADPALTYVATGLVGTDTLTGRLARASGETAGTYAIGQGTLTAGPNYAMSFTGATFTITQTTALAKRPNSSILSRDLEARTPRLFANRSSRAEEGRLETVACDPERPSCLSVEVLLPGASQVSIAIYDNLGVPVIAFQKEIAKADLARLATSGDGRRVLPVAWNLRARGGAAVEAGVYLWRITVLAADGQRLETVKRLGVQLR